MKQAIAFLALFTSASTIVCCALPALFVTLGFGATVAGAVGAFPQLIWISEHKSWFFGLGAVFLILGAVLQVHSRQLTCPSESNLMAACRMTRSWSGRVFIVATAMYLVGAFFAYIAPLLF